MVGGRVLLVDGHETGRVLLARLLRLSGFEVSTAERVTDARRMLAGGTFDLLITELTPAELPEFELMRWLRAATTTRGVLLTAHDEIWLKGWQRAGFSGAMRKPIEFDRLLSKLRRILGGRSSQSKHNAAAGEIPGTEETPGGAGRSVRVFIDASLN